MQITVWPWAASVDSKSRSNEWPCPVAPVVLCGFSPNGRCQPVASAKQRIREFLREHVGEVVTSRDLQEAAGPVTEWARRLRELRTDEGWEIHSHHDDNSLSQNEYRLVSEPPEAGPKQESPTISRRVRAEVLARDGSTCQMCGVAAGDIGEDGRPVRLHMGHIVDKSHGGTPEPSNLRALCSTCNEGAKNLTREPPRRIWLLTQVRTATRDDQREVLAWLQRKFGEEPG